jgi:hypothetical protein
MHRAVSSCFGNSTFLSSTASPSSGFDFPDGQGDDAIVFDSGGEKLRELNKTRSLPAGDVKRDDDDMKASHTIMDDSPKDMTGTRKRRLEVQIDQVDAIDTFYDHESKNDHTTPFTPDFQPVSDPLVSVPSVIMTF